MSGKIKIASYWGAGCGGCDVAILDIDDKILDVHALADVVFWPIGFDGKEKDLEALPDGSITVTFYNGAIRNEENDHIARLLRKKSQIMIAFGTCAVCGGTPGLANVTNRKGIMDMVYRQTESTHNPEGVMPQTKLEVPEGGFVTLPKLYNSVLTLDDIVDVDYYMPGCPPETPLIVQALNLIIDHLTTGAPLPPKGAVIASDKTLCDECDRERNLETDRNIERIYQPYEIMPDEDKCLIDQGILCVGPATRAGCGAMCPKGNMPCRGCMGPTAAAIDQGSSMLSAISSILDVRDDDANLSEDDIDEIMEQIKDPLGTFYAFSLPKSLIKRVVREKNRPLQQEVE